MRALAFGVAVASIPLALAATMLAWLNGAPLPTGMSLGSRAMELGAPLGLLSYVATGAVIAARYPRHALAWFFLLIGLGAELWLVLVAYGIYGTLTAPGTLPASGLALWIATWSLRIPQYSLPLGLLWTPDGRLPSPRWRIVVWLTVGAMVVAATAEAFRSHPDLPIERPIGIAVSPEVVGGVAQLGMLMSLAAMSAAGAALIQRFRGAQGVERQQLKWFAYATTILMLTNVPVAIVAAQTDPSAIIDLDPVVTTISVSAVFLYPLSAAVAILRYRLYDIDLLIKRTLVYGSLTMALGVVYVASVLLSQQMLRGFTGGSDIAVAGSTLLVVALFQPIRTRVQEVVDRRFYRARYDATRTIDAFAGRLRGDVDLDSVRADLIGVVHDTIHPAHASVWLRSARR
jgi:hypothetical protein